MGHRICKRGDARSIEAYFGHGETRKKSGRPSGNKTSDYAALVKNALDCPSLEKIPDGERRGCGLAHRCTAGQSSRPCSEVSFLDCWECPMAPRTAIGTGEHSP